MKKCNYILLFLSVALFLTYSNTELLYAQRKIISDETVNRIHKEIISIDTHNDSESYLLHPSRHNSLSTGQVSIAKMYEGGLDAAFFAVYLEQKANDLPSLDSVYEQCKNELRLFMKYEERHKDSLVLIRSPKELLSMKKSGKRGAVMAIENGYGIGDKVERINEFFNMGVRYITLCHSKNNLICESSTETRPGEKTKGLTEFGKRVVQRMNEVGMIIDVSHSSSATLMDVLKYSKAPIIASHSGVWNIKHNARNLRDSEMVAIAEHGGLIQVATGRYFLSSLPKSQVGVSILADHIDYVKNLVAIEHVGIGTDFDGGGGVVGMENCSKMKSLTKELLSRGYSQEDLRLFWGGNLMRVWGEILHIGGVKQ